MRFDEIHVIRKVKISVSDLYSRLTRYHRILCEKVMKKAYLDGLLLAEKAGFQQPKKKVNVIVPGLVASLFHSYHPVTQYQYTKEHIRKRDRLVEGTISSQTRLAYQEVIRQGANAWYRQAKQYVDLSVDNGRMQAFQDAGVEKVRWVSEKDAKVCSVCGDRDGQEYDLYAVPPKPHRNCRCHLVPVSRSQQTP